MSSFLDRLKKILQIRADTTDITETTSQSNLESILSGQAISTVVDKEQLMNIPAVAASIHFISCIIATLPIQLFQRTASGAEEVKNDYRLDLLNHETGDLLDSYQTKKAMIEDMLIFGAGYIFLNKLKNNILSIHYVRHDAVSIMTNADPIFKKAIILINGQQYLDYLIMHITRNTTNGCNGVGVLSENTVLFSAMYNSLKYENSSMAIGGKKGFLTSEKKLDNKQFNSLKTAWRNLFSNTDNNNVMILNEGIKFEPASSTASENQLSENKKTNTQQVYTLFGLSEDLFSGSSTAGVAQEALNKAIKTCIKPIVTALQSALNKFILLEKKKKNYFFKMDLDEITKADILTRYQAYSAGLKSNWLQMNDVREKENLKPVENWPYIQLGLSAVLYNPKTGEFYIPNTGQTGDPKTMINPNSKGKEEGGKQKNES